jgi:hypothetical protein
MKLFQFTIVGLGLVFGQISLAQTSPAQREIRALAQQIVREADYGYHSETELRLTVRDLRRTLAQLQNGAPPFQPAQLICRYIPQWRGWAVYNRQTNQQLGDAVALESACNESVRSYRAGAFCAYRHDYRGFQPWDVAGHRYFGGAYPTVSECVRRNGI